MLKNELFLLKRCKNRPALGDSPPDLLAFGGWGLRPQTPDNPLLIENSWLRSCFVPSSRYGLLKVLV